MSSPWIFICPSSRGIGRALTRRLLQTTTLPILATTRDPDLSSAKAQLLEGLASSPATPTTHPGPEDIAPRLSLVNLDVTDDASMSAASRHAAALFPPSTHHLRLACAVPGVLHPEKNPRQIDPALSLETFRVNAIGPLLLLRHFAHFLPQLSTALSPSPAADQVKLPASSAVWLSMSARVGSISDNRAGGWYSYRASKTAVSSFTKSFDNYLAARSGAGALAVAYHPGTVKTDLSRDYWASVGEDRLFSPELAAEKMVDFVAGVGERHRGRTWDWKGEEVPP